MMQKPTQVRLEPDVFDDLNREAEERMISRNKLVNALLRKGLDELDRDDR